jgi:hypothetical protein
MTTAFGCRAHLYARPETREPLRRFFSEILGAPAEEIPGTTMLVCRLAEGTSVSVEFTADALDDAHGLRGAWLEIRTDDPVALQQRVIAAGLRRVEHPVTRRFYFRSPDGQVWGIAGLASEASATQAAGASP